MSSKCVVSCQLAFVFFLPLPDATPDESVVETASDVFRLRWASYLRVAASSVGCGTPALRYLMEMTVPCQRLDVDDRRHQDRMDFPGCFRATWRSYLGV